MGIRDFKFWQYLDSKFGIPKDETPRALPWGFNYTDEPHEYDWDDWHRDMKKKYPIRHWVFHEFSIWLSVKHRSLFEEPIYKFKSLHIKKQHLLDLRKGNWSPDSEYGIYKYGYTDPCNVVELAIYASFVNYMDEIEANYSDEDGISAIDKCIKNAEEWLKDDCNIGAPNAWLDHYQKMKKIKEFFEDELPKLERKSFKMYPPKGITRAEAEEYYDKKKAFDKDLKDKINKHFIMIIEQREFMWT